MMGTPPDAGATRLEPAPNDAATAVSPPGGAATQQAPPQAGEPPPRLDHPAAAPFAATPPPSGQAAPPEALGDQAAGAVAAAGPAPAGAASGSLDTAAPPPPRQPSATPVRQLASIAIALALGPGRSPRLTVALDPEELGRVEIRIERGKDNEAATVRVLAERPETLALLQRDARELDRALHQAGVDVAPGGTSFGLGGQDRPAQGQAGPRRQPGQGQPGQGQSGRGHEPPSASFAMPRPTGAGLSLLDIAV